MHIVRRLDGVATYEPAEPVWRKSRRSTSSGECVELSGLPGRVAVRDSKDRQGPALLFPSCGWGAFVGGVKAGRFDLSR